MTRNKAKGQSYEELMDTLKNLKGHDLVFTNYTITATTPDGNELKLSYDKEEEDTRFN